MDILFRRRNRETWNTILCGAMSCVFLVTCLATPAPATALVEEGSGNGEDASEVIEKKRKKYQTIEPSKSDSDTKKKKWLIIGGAAAIGIGALAVAAGGGGSSSSSGGSSSGSSQPACEDGLIGPSLAGKWQGVLNLKNYGSQPVTATVTHCGERITINTSSTLPYGQSFSGRVSSGGSILLKEGVTYQIWSSHLGPARTNDLRVYDYVNNETQLDSLKLSR